MSVEEFDDSVYLRSIDNQDSLLFNQFASS